jgi:hypothetical protein
LPSHEEDRQIPTFLISDGPTNAFSKHFATDLTLKKCSARYLLHLKNFGALHRAGDGPLMHALVNIFSLYIAVNFQSKGMDQESKRLAEYYM